MIKKLVCKLAGHNLGSWFKTVQGACSQHPFSDGIQCYRCGKLLGVWDERSNLIKVNGDIQAPLPVDACFEKPTKANEIINKVINFQNEI